MARQMAVGLRNRVQLTGETRRQGSGAEQVFRVLVQQVMDQDLAGYSERKHTVLAVSRGWREYAGSGSRSDLSGDCL